MGRGERQMRRLAARTASKAFGRQVRAAAVVTLADVSQRLVIAEQKLQTLQETFARLIMVLGQKGVLNVEQKTQSGIIMPGSGTPDSST